MLHLLQYGGSDDEGSADDRDDEITSHLKPLGSGKSIAALQNKMQVCSAPDVVPTVSLDHKLSN
jgi:hypothetical protein